VRRESDKRGLRGIGGGLFGICRFGSPCLGLEIGDGMGGSWARWSAEMFGLEAKLFWVEME
jgi:hypothetical protein